MGSSFAQIADQHLAFARIQIEHLGIAETKFDKNAYKQSAGLHLVESLLAYLHELDISGVDTLARYTSLSAVFVELEQKFNFGDKVDFRLIEILELADKKDSWLNTLIDFQTRMRKPQQFQARNIEDRDHAVKNIEPSSTSSREGLIATSTLNPIEKPPWFVDLASESAEGHLTIMVEQMASLIRRHREFAAEY